MIVRPPLCWSASRKLGHGPSELSNVGPFAARVHAVREQDDHEVPAGIDQEGRTGKTGVAESSGGGRGAHPSRISDAYAEAMPEARVDGRWQVIARHFGHGIQA
jgi:hypothetical protein